MRVAKLLLTTQNRGASVTDVLALRECIDGDQLFVQPLLPRVHGCQVALHFGIGHDPPAVQVDQEHRAWLQPPLRAGVAVGDVQDAGFRCEDDEVVVGDLPATWPQAVAVHDGANGGAVRESYGCRPVPRFHQAGGVLVKGAQLGVEQGVLFPRLGDQHCHGVGEGTPGKGE